jgi:hypothetical protein
MSCSAIVEMHQQKNSSSGAASIIVDRNSSENEEDLANPPPPVLSPPSLGASPKSAFHAPNATAATNEHQQQVVRKWQNSY